MGESSWLVVLTNHTTAMINTAAEIVIHHTFLRSMVLVALRGMIVHQEASDSKSRSWGVVIGYRVRHWSMASVAMMIRNPKPSGVGNVARNNQNPPSLGHHRIHALIAVTSPRATIAYPLIRSVATVVLGSNGIKVPFPDFNPRGHDVTSPTRHTRQPVQGDRLGAISYAIGCLLMHRYATMCNG